jgi:raffinose/stachyose/melibiose transport system permease protein
LKANSKWTPYLLIAPALAIFSFAVLAPMLGTIWLSFQKWNGFGSPQFHGIKNYQRAIGDPVFTLSLKNIAIYIAVTLILEVGLGLILAGLVTSRKRTSYYRIALFTPVMLPMVVVAVLWRFVLNPDFGLINSILELLGFESMQQLWLGNPRTALLALCVVSGWVYSGFYLAIFFAGLQRIPTEIIESASLDGASKLRTFIQIKVPMIRRIWEIAILLCITGGLQGFDLFYVMTNGGPYNTTEVPTTYMVKTVFRDQEFGYGSSLAVIVTVLVLGIGFIFSRLRKKSEAVIEY